MRTLHFTNAWHASSGGISTFYNALLQSAEQAGWQSRLVVPSTETRYEPVGRLTGIYHVRARRAPLSPEYRILYPHQYLFPNAPIREILRREQPHLVEVCDKYTLPYLAGLLRLGAVPGMVQRPALIGLSCERADENMAAYLGLPRAARQFARLYMRMIYFRLFDHHVVVSSHVAQELEAASRGHRVERGVWIRGMGVDSVRFHPARRSAEVRRRLISVVGAADSDTLLLYAGRLAPEKNVPLLLDLLDAMKAQHSECKLLVAGDGPLRNEFLIAGEHRHPGRIAYLGHLTDREEFANLLANVDIFLHPNPREPFGIGPLEAMASALPVVGPDAGGLKEYASASNSWLTAPTPSAFAAAIHAIQSDPVERERRTAEARATAERFGWQNVCARFLGLYENLYARVSGGPVAEIDEPAFYSTPGNRLGFESRPRRAEAGSRLLSPDDFAGGAPSEQ